MSVLAVRVKDETIEIFDRVARASFSTTPRLLDTMAQSLSDGKITYTDNNFEMDDVAREYMERNYPVYEKIKRQKRKWTRFEEDRGYGYVYKYLDLNDSEVKYVGLVRPGNSLRKRIKDHRKDVWYHDNYEIYYIKLTSQTDCEYCESFFINHYKTVRFNNIAKTKWGISEFIKPEQFEWTRYVD